MKSCQLFQEGLGWGAKVQDVKDVMTTSGPHRETVFKKEIHHKTLEEVSDFLMSHGVEDGEIDVAVEVMVKNEHNVANFGLFGSFIYSAFQGVIH